MPLPGESEGADGSAKAHVNPIGSIAADNLCATDLSPLSQKLAECCPHREDGEHHAR